MLSIIIPTLNAEQVLGPTLSAIDAPGGHNPVWVVDGGSTDATVRVAEDYGARVITCEPGRGQQLSLGVDRSIGSYLLFLHADTRLAPGWRQAVEDFMAVADNADRAAYFRFELDDAAPGARRIERLAMLRARKWGLPYGDQGLLMSRALYDAVGGFNPLPLMEDVDLVRRLGPARLRGLAVAAVTSAIRYRQGGYWLRPARNLTCLGLYFLGIPPHLLTRLYG